MAIKLKNSKKIVIDRTLTEIMNCGKNINGDYAVEFIDLLNKICVDLVEIDSANIHKIKKLPNNLSYVLKIKSQEDTLLLDEYKFEYVVIDYRSEIKLESDIKVILEIDLDDLDKIYLDENRTIFNKLNIRNLRLKNIDKFNLFGWTKIIKDIKAKLNVNVDFCANDKYFLATAIGISGCLDGADFITTTFNGERYGFTSLEELILALKVIENAEILGDLKLISKATEVYKKLTGEEIYCMKPILGNDIFKYESGIHVDGIEKNPKTYEAFNPYEIGVTREMFIGKHSGKKAIMVKLKENNLDYEKVNIELMLSEVREKSMKLRRNIFNEELVEMYKKLI